MKKQGFIRKKEGNVAIEFALIAPVLFLLVMGILEFALVMFASAIIESAATSAARVGLTGRDEANNYGDTASRAVFVRAEIDRLSGGLLDTSQIVFEPKVFAGFDNIAGAGTDGLGGADEGVMYELRYDWEFFTPLIGQFFGASDIYTIASTVIIKNEGFGSSADSLGSRP